MKTVFAPGCALMLYKPELAEKLHLILNKNLGEMDELQICCRHDPQLATMTKVINICPGCDKRFGNDYKNTSTISLWEILAESDFFIFPDYYGRRMSIIDACPTREQERVHNAIRTIIHKMNITLVEPKNTRTKSICCGDSFYGIISTEEVKKQMIKRTSEMPMDDVIVYCVSCIKSVYIGGKKPQYLLDLLFANETVTKTYEPDEWHKELDNYIEKH
ncbi:MAG: heterodisulfide reductase-related iron-sulfur binding cluster [Bacteroidales bacterium]|jgi:Fe-S oxidoreductase